MRQINTRNDFGSLAQDFYIFGIGAEIGVAGGNFSRLISESWKGTILCVDINEMNLTGEPFKMMQGYSVKVAKQIKDESLDWVYIDAGHYYEDIKNDYYAWYPKVRSGGLVAGHDYGDNEFDVKRFIDELDIKVNLTTKDIINGTYYDTWYFEKCQ